MYLFLLFYSNYCLNSQNNNMSNGHSVILLIYFKKQYNTSYSINQSIDILFLYEWNSINIIETFILEQSISSDLSECSCNAGKLRINVPKNRYATTLPCKIFSFSYTLFKTNLVVISNIIWHISFKICSQYFYDYINVILDDHSRVILSSTRNDYINANIIRVCVNNSYLHIEHLYATVAFLNLTTVTLDQLY